jgi:hypothetical protein
VITISRYPNARLAPTNVEQSNAGRAINTPRRNIEGLSSLKGWPSDSGGYPEQIPACEAGTSYCPSRGVGNNAKRNVGAPATNWADPIIYTMGTAAIIMFAVWALLHLGRWAA